MKKYIKTIEALVNPKETCLMSVKQNNIPPNSKKHIPHATLALGSWARWASNTASLIWSHILSAIIQFILYQ